MTNSNRSRFYRAPSTAVAAERTLSVLAANPGLVDDLQMAHPILQSIAADFKVWGRLSDKQIALVRKLAKESRERLAMRATEKLVAAPTGRVTFRGKVVSAKTHYAALGRGHSSLTLKMTVKMDTPEGAWLVWVTCPQSVQDDLWSDVEQTAWRAAGRAQDAETGSRLKGREVEVTAALSVKDKPSFAFGSRPTGKLIPLPAAVVEAAQAEIAEAAIAHEQVTAAYQTDLAVGCAMQGHLYGVEEPGSRLVRCMICGTTKL